MHFNKKGKFSKNNKSASYGQKARVGAYSVNIPQRQFIGDAPEVTKIIKGVVDDNVKEAVKGLFNGLIGRNG